MFLKMDDIRLEETIFKQIENRNKLYSKFTNLIKLNNELQQSKQELSSSYEQLRADFEKLQLENHDLTAKLNSSVPVVKQNEHASALEQRLNRALEELTELHRSKSARAQQVIDLNVAVQEKEKELIDINQKLQEKENKLKTVQQSLEKYEDEISRLKQANITLNDEYQALLLTNDVIGNKLRECQLENRSLLDRWLNYKDQEAKALNVENDKIHNVQVENPINNPEAQPKPRPASISQGSSSPPANIVSSSSLKESPRPQKPDEPQQPHPINVNSNIVLLPTEALCTWKPHESEVTCVRFSVSGGTLATGGLDRFIHTWNFVGDKPRLLSTLRGCNGAITSIDFDPQEAFLAASSSDHACRVWTLCTQRLKVTLTGHRNGVLSSKFLNVSNRLASGGKDRTVKVWDLSQGACTRTFMAGSSCTDIVAADAVDCLVSGHFDKKIRVWDTRIGGQPQSEIVVGGRVTSLDMPCDKTMLVCCTKDHTLELIDLRKNSLLSVFSNDAFRVATDQAGCAFSPDGNYVCAGSGDGSVISWDVKRGSVLSSVKEHDDPVISCNWNGGRVVSGDKNKTCVIWTESS